MTYQTDSEHSPLDSTNTGELTASIIRRVKGNPFHVNATDIGWPTYYDAWPNKTNDQMSSVNVTDETHTVSEVDQDSNNALYLNHRPKLGSNITIAGDATAVLDTGAGVTDYTHGIVYFSTMPTGDFSVEYMADPDKYYGEFINQLQDGLHEIQNVLGAGGTINEGIKNAEIWVDSSSAELSVRLPNKIHVRELTQDTAIKSADSDLVGNTIQFGNGADNLYLKSDSMQIGDDTGDIVQMDGILKLSPTGQSLNPAYSVADVTGEDTGDYDALKVFGDAFIGGDLRILGNQTTINIEQTVSTSVVNDNWHVKGTTYLGDNSDDILVVAGPATVTGAFTQVGAAGEDATFYHDIVLQNSGATSLVDGLDPSYIAAVQGYIRPAGPDWAGDCLNMMSIGILTDSGASTGGIVSTASATASNAYEVVDTDATGTNTFLSAGDGNGLYHPGRFDDGTWFLRVTSGVNIGDYVRVSSFDTGSGTWTLTRSLSSVTEAGAAYEVVNPYLCESDVLSGNSTTLTVRASTTTPVIGSNNGQIKIRQSNQALSAGSNGRFYVHLTQDVTGQGDLEQAAIFAINNRHAGSDQSVVVGEYERVGGSFQSVVSYRPNLKYDSGWRLVEAGGGTRLSPSATNVIHHRVGGKFRIPSYKIKIMEADDSTVALLQAPDEDTIRVRPVGAPGAAYAITALNENTLTFQAPASGVWIRLIVEA